MLSLVWDCHPRRFHRTHCHGKRIDGDVCVCAELDLARFSFKAMHVDDRAVQEDWVAIIMGAASPGYQRQSEREPLEHTGFYGSIDTLAR